MIFAFIIVLGLSSKSKGQTYYPLIESGKSWNVLTSTMADWFTSTYELNGDTIISGLNYKKLYERNKFYISGKYLGGIREETPGKRVYFCGSNEAGEGLLYDFSLLTGDTITIRSNIAWKGFSLTFHVDSVDQVSDENGLSRKRISLSSQSGNYGEEWVEGDYIPKPGE